MVKRTCPSCGKPVYSADTFSEYWTCCHCGAPIQKIQEVNKDEAAAIIETRYPRGLFYLVKDDYCIGIDNRTGDAWTEEFG